MKKYFYYCYYKNRLDLLETLSRMPEIHFENHYITILFSVAIFFFFIPHLVPFSMAVCYTVVGKSPVILHVSLKVVFLTLTVALGLSL